MGNFTSSSWGLVQMKTNGEEDSSQVSGNFRSGGSGGGRRKKKSSLASSYTGLAWPYCARNMLKLMMPCIAVMNHSVSVYLYAYIMLDVLLAWCNTTCLIATDSYESHWVLCTIIAHLMMPSLMRAVAALANSKDKTKFITTGTKIQDIQTLSQM